MTDPIKRFIRVPHGDVAYLETGAATRPPVLFVHGIPTSGYLWRHVLRFLQNDFHCYAPDLMGLGDTEVDPVRGGYDMDAQAEMLAEFMTAHGHESFGLVCHDQGGAAAQILATRFKKRVRALVITDAVCYDNWPVPAIARLQKLANLPLVADLAGRTGLIEWVETRSWLSTFRRGVYRRERLTDESIREYLRPLRQSAEARGRFLRFLMAGHKRFTELVVPELKKCDVPTLIVWAADDHFISPSWGRQLAEDIPGTVGFELVPFCGHYWQEERPAEFASYIGGFLAEHLSQVSGAKKKRARPARKARKTKHLEAVGGS